MSKKKPDLNVTKLQVISEYRYLEILLKYFPDGTHHPHEAGYDAFMCGYGMYFEDIVIFILVKK